MLDGIRLLVQRELKINLLSEIRSDEATPPPEGEEFEEENNVSLQNTAISLLSEASSLGYERIRCTICEELKIRKKCLPSYLILTKDRPAIEAVVVLPNNAHTLRMVDRTYTAIQNLDKFVELQASNMMEQQTCQTVATDEIPAETHPLCAAKIVGTYGDYVSMMKKKHAENGHLMGDNEKLIVLDSYDGAEHSTTAGKRLNVVSYSSQAQVFSRGTVAAGVTTAGSFNILTWQQVIGEEKCANVFPVLESIFEQKKKLMDEHPNISIYEMHDGKMLYLLTQHALFNCKHHPFLLCKCKWGDGVRDPNHTCELVSQEDQCLYYERSKRRWTRKHERLAFGEKYSTTDHMRWVDLEKFGVSHFGLSAVNLRRDNIWFNIFHLRSSITRRLMIYLRKFMMLQTENLLSEFTTILQTFWREYLVDMWNLNKAFTSFKGADIKAFIKNIPTVVNFLRTKFAATDLMNTFCDALFLWKEISRFIHIVGIDDPPHYATELANLRQTLQVFMNAGVQHF
eukprot:scaffold90288_cov52-Attheya_sp.AAC.5